MASAQIPSYRNDAKTLQKAILKLEKMIRVQRDADAGLVTIEVRARWPELAEQLASRLVL